MISSELYLDEINLQVDYAKIESGLNKLKNNNENINNTKLKDSKNNNSCLNCNNIQTDYDLYYYSDDDDKEKGKK